MSNMLIATPRFSHLPFSIPVMSAVGYLSAKISQGNDKMLAAAGAIYALADNLFYQLSYFIGKHCCKSVIHHAPAVYTVTNALVSASALVGLRALELISNQATLLLSLLSITVLVARVSMISQRQV